MKGLNEYSLDVKNKVSVGLYFSSIPSRSGSRSYSTTTKIEIE